ncbi:HAD-IA family hydrolase [Klenkia sp. PcliD-1-E]|uniref:HAD-IA family hydrolase n=1 Tax=Klenkia sp. PcliD-1-E TaxID=2954492 RepID=UPI002096DC68|nr:HAD-IA family hydrolase [Klenkia sp. PcliD-1-E]MCO7221607.1 HAD-IA family hydrolase [Klenkia sp. PcliD-1-E]
MTPDQQLAPDLHVPARGILFDNDGVLVDSLASVEGSWTRWAQVHGIEPGRALDVVHGRRAADTVALLVAEEQRAAAVDLIEAIELEDAGVCAAMAGIPALLAQLPPGSWAVVTSGTRRLATARLQAAGIPVPEVFVTADDVALGKPDPAGYLAAASGLGLAPADALVVEDSPSGIAAGLAAGCPVLGVGEEALHTDAAVVVRDLAGSRWAGDGLLLPAATVLRGPTRH